jgi:hypothetical protein
MRFSLADSIKKSNQCFDSDCCLLLNGLFARNFIYITLHNLRQNLPFRLPESPLAGSLKGLRASAVVQQMAK